MKYPISLMSLDAFSIVFLETAKVEVNRQEITPALVRFFLTSAKWGELGYCQLKMIDQKTTDLFFSDPSVPQLNEALIYFAKISKQERFRMAKDHNLPGWRARKNYKLITKLPKYGVRPKENPMDSLLSVLWDDEEKDMRRKDLRIVDDNSNNQTKNIYENFITDVVFEQRQIIMRDLQKQYNIQLRIEFNLSDELIPGPVQGKRRGGPIPTPDEEKDKMIDDWEKVRGTMTIQVFCRKKHIGESTFRLWRSERKNKNRPPLT